MESTKSSTLYYFSGTGNSLKIAKDLAEKLQNCKLEPIALYKHENKIVSKSEKVGFIFPLYFWGLPQIVYDFINKIEIDNAIYIFAVITRGGPIRGAALHQIRKLLHNNSKTLNAGFFLTMLSNYVMQFDIPSELKQKKKLAKAHKKVDKLSEIIEAEKNHINREKIYLLGKLINKRFRNNVNKRDKKFYADTNCNSCGICEKACTQENIKIVEGKPQWQHKCQKCLACIHFCPQEAIQYGKRTIGKRRYHHPEISLKEMIIKTIN